MTLFALSLVAANLAQGQVAPTNPDIFIPECSVPRTQDVGLRVHTNYMMNLDGPAPVAPGIGHGPLVAFFSGPSGFHPSDIRGAYNDNGTGGGLIAIVDAFDDPDALIEFNTFANQFGLPTEPSNNATSPSNKVFQVLYATGSQPSGDGGWAVEMSLDIEWAHAMAPNAKIMLVEAASNSWDDMLYAVDKAAAAGAGSVSMSWAGGEFGGEIAYDAHFARRNVEYFAASGDWGNTVVYPSASPLCISCGGTSLSVSNGQWAGESMWSGSGGGPSVVEPRPSYQNGIGLVGSQRGTPDIAAVADPNTGVAIYSLYGWGGWGVVGGTSVATPVLCGIKNASTGVHRSSEWIWFYAHQGLFHDITTGNNGYPAGPGYDFGTGIGTPITAESL